MFHFIQKLSTSIIDKKNFILFLLSTNNSNMYYRIQINIYGIKFSRHESKTKLFKYLFYFILKLI